MRKKLSLLPTITIIFLLSAFNSNAQDSIAEKKAPDLTFVFKKIGEKGFELKARLSLFENRIDFPISGEKIKFILGSDSIITIDGNITDKDGYAIAFINPGVKLPKNQEGIIVGRADFEGNMLYEPVQAEVSFIETKISLEFLLVDTIKTVKVTASKINKDDTESPLTGETVTISIQRMFSRLPISDVTIGDDGTATAEFPLKIPGDSLGNVDVVAFIAENEIYGNSESSDTIKWGIPKQEVLITHRALWTQIAPMWMIVSLTILLIGVWAHYLYVIIQLILVRNKNKQLKLE